jgi:hypothetical protein
VLEALEASIDAGGMAMTLERNSFRQRLNAGFIVSYPVEELVARPCAGREGAYSVFARCSGTKKGFLCRKRLNEGEVCLAHNLRREVKLNRTRRQNK